MNVYLKTGLSLLLSFIIVFGLTKIVFYPDRPEIREDFNIILDRATSPIIGGTGEPVREGVDPTPPNAINR